MVIHKDWKTFGLPTETGIDLVYIRLYYIILYYIIIYIYYYIYIYPINMVIDGGIYRPPKLGMFTHWRPVPQIQVVSGHGSQMLNLWVALAGDPVECWEVWVERVPGRIGRKDLRPSPVVSIFWCCTGLVGLISILCIWRFPTIEDPQVTMGFGTNITY